MRRELECDRQMGFIGKTVIHPKQIPLVNEAYKVSRKDYEDALAILNWNPQNVSLVSGSRENDRMNEFKTHRNWAEKILFLAKSYGIRQE
jgi:citrate lyase beta subunit